MRALSALLLVALWVWTSAREFPSVTMGLPAEGAFEPSADLAAHNGVRARCV
jgi:hypothetical protein